MADRFYDALAREDFNKARLKAFFSRIVAMLRSERDELLSFQEVKSLIRPRSESYRGMKTIPIERIIGSEGRYRDFNKGFLPRHTHLRGRWERVDVAHHAQVILPPVKLYEIGGIYFVRDGNHRVSVARAQGVEFIDAEVIALDSRLRLRPDTSREELRRAVIELEKEQFYSATRLLQHRPQARIEFTSTGRYEELIRHIHGHKYYINQTRQEEIPFREAMLSWYDTVYAPIVAIIRQENILAGFPGRTEADLYVWIVGHWDGLKRSYGGKTTIREAAGDFRRRFGRVNLAGLLGAGLRRLRDAWAGRSPGASGKG